MKSNKKKKKKIMMKNNNKVKWERKEKEERKPNQKGKVLKCSFFVVDIVCLLCNHYHCSKNDTKKNLSCPLDVKLYENKKIGKK